MNNRIKWIDTAKGIAMICVVLGHMSISYINDIVFAFHMPVFFILSGYMMRMKPHEVNRAYIQNKFRSLMKPYFITCLCVMCMDILNSKFILDDARIEMLTSIVVNDLIRGFFASGTIDTFGEIQLPGIIGAIWFLPAMFFTSIGAQYVINRFDKKQQFAIAGLLMALGICTRDFIWLPFSIQAAFGAIIFVILGYYLEDDLIDKMKLWIVVPVFVLGVYLKYSRIYMVTAYYRDPILSMITAVAGVFLIIRLAKRMENFRFVNFIGKYSLFFLCVHLFELETMNVWFQRLIQLIGISEKNSIIALIVIKFVFILSITSVLVKLSEFGRKLNDGRKDKLIVQTESAVVIMKVLAIIMILAGDFSLNSEMAAMMNSVCLPILIFSSGYLCRENQGMKSIKTAAGELLIPYFFSAAVIVCVQYFCGEIGNNQIAEQYLKYVWGTEIGKVSGPLYILLLLFIIKSLYFVVDSFIAKKMFKHFMILGISAIGYTLGVNNWYLPYGIDIACYALAFFYVGKIFREKEGFAYFRNNYWWYFILSSVWAYMLYTGGIEISNRSYNEYSIGILGSIAGVCTIFLACIFLIQSVVVTKIMNKILTKTKGNVVCIICLHSVVNGILSDRLAAYLDKEYIYMLVVSVMIQIGIGIGIGRLVKEADLFR